MLVTSTDGYKKRRFDLNWNRIDRLDRVIQALPTFSLFPPSMARRAPSHISMGLVQHYLKCLYYV